MQFILLAETKNKDGSDYKYIKECLNYLYDGMRGNRISFIPMNGKENYCKKEKEIFKLISKYNGDFVVIIFIDLDSPGCNIDQQILNNSIIEYCRKNGYHLVCFNKTIENVFLGKVVKRDKQKLADEFLRKGLIKSIKVEKLNIAEIINIKEGESNIKYIMDSILKHQNINSKNPQKLNQNNKKVPQ